MNELSCDEWRIDEYEMLHGVDVQTTSLREGGAMSLAKPSIMCFISAIFLMRAHA